MGNTTSLCADLEYVELSLPQGDSARIALYGAQVLSWKTADQVEQLFLSPRAVLDGTQPIRGGIPLCFPQFNKRVLSAADGTPFSSVPKHGFARTSVWAVTHHTGDAVTLQLTDSAATRAVWPFQFRAQLQVKLQPQALELTFSVDNLSQEAFAFALAFHTYLRVDDIEATQLEGLQNQSFWDAVAWPQESDRRAVQSASAFTFVGEVDRVYSAASNPLSVRATSVLQLQQSENLSETIVWNPGAQLCATLSDMEPEGFRHMVCVEAGKIDQPVTLFAGEHWQASIRLTQP